MKKECKNGQNVDFRETVTLDGFPKLIEVRRVPKPENGAGRRTRDRVEVLFDGKPLKEMSTSQNLINSSVGDVSETLLSSVQQPPIVEATVSSEPRGSRRFSLPTELSEKLSRTNLRNAYDLDRAMRSESWSDFVDFLRLSQQDIEALDKAVVDYLRRGRTNSKKF